MISFYNDEVDFMEPLNIKPCVVAHTFKKVAKKTGIKITPYTLRSIFAREMSRAGVQDRYIDTFCGRVPGSVLARHYSDYSPEALKEIYEKVDLHIL